MTSLVEWRRKIRVAVLRLLCCLSMLLPTAHAENWPRFRGPTGQGISEEMGLPATWSETENIVWKVAVEGDGWSSPIVWDDLVIVTSSTAAGADCFLTAFDRSTGSQRWHTLVFQQTPRHKERKNSHATPTPVTDGEHIYAVFSEGGVAAVTLDGQVKWINQETKFYSRHGLGASPILFDNLLIMAYDGSNEVPAAGSYPNNSDQERLGWQIPWDQARVIALDKATGRQAWVAKRGMSRIAHTTPILVHDPGRGKQVLVSTAGDAIQGFDPASGDLLWTAYSQGEGVTPSPAADSQHVFTASGFEKTTLRTLRLGGTGDVTKTHVAWEQREGAPTQASLLYLEPYLYAITDAGVARCYQASSGEVVWTQRIGGNHSASPVAGDGKIYFLAEDGETTVIAAGPEYKLIAKNKIDGHCQASLAVSEGKLWLRSETHLYCIGTQ